MWFPGEGAGAIAEEEEEGAGSGSGNGSGSGSGSGNGVGGEAGLVPSNNVWSGSAMRRRAGASDLLAGPRNAWNSTPMVALRDIAELCAGLHFREHRYVRSKGVVVSVNVAAAADEAESYWEQLPPMQLAAPEEEEETSEQVQGALAALDLWSRARWEVVMRNVNAQDVTQTFYVTAGRLYEDLPVDIPSAYRERSRSTPGGMPVSLDGLAACFASGLGDEDAVSLRWGEVWSVGACLFISCPPRGAKLTCVAPFPSSAVLSFVLISLLSPLSRPYVLFLRTTLCSACERAAGGRNACRSRNGSDSGVRGQDRDVSVGNLPRESSRAEQGKGEYYCCRRVGGRGGNRMK